MSTPINVTLEKKGSGEVVGFTFYNEKKIKCKSHSEEHVVEMITQLLKLSGATDFHVETTKN